MLGRRPVTLSRLGSTDSRGKDLKTAKYKAGFGKIEATCRLARKRNIDYAWIDTCCIDRTSSADLTEAINSMFRIYEASSVCFVYLADLPSLPHLPPGSQAPYTASRGSDRETTGACEPQGFAQVPPLLRRCRWLTRGWTLQELIAPKRVEFHDRFWYFRGSKSLWIKPLAEITGIHPRALASSRNLDEHSVAARFSWAAQRQTTRVEDAAYCLMGIFGVHMPVIYGEHASAFIRLQEEICKKTNDLSLFAWTAQPRDGPQDSLRGLFATSPDEFAQCARVARLPALYARDSEFSATNKGLCFHAPLMPSGIRVNHYVMPLECSESYNISPGGKTATTRQPVGIHLAEVGGRFVRVRPDELHIFADGKTAGAGGDTSLSPSTAIYARGTLSRTEVKGLIKELNVKVVAIRLLLPGNGIRLLQKEPRAAWHAPQAAFCTARAGRREGFLCFWLVHVKARDVAPGLNGHSDDGLKGNLQTLRHPAFQCLIVCVLDAERRTYVWTEQEEDRWRTANPSPVARPIVGRGMKSKLGGLHQSRDTTATVTVSAPKITWIHGGDGRCDLEFSVTHNAVGKS